MQLASQVDNTGTQAPVDRWTGAGAGDRLSSKGADGGSVFVYFDNLFAYLLAYSAGVFFLRVLLVC